MRKAAQQALTHYVWWDEPGRRLVRAACGRLIARREHVNEPTCPDCRRIVESNEQGPVTGRDDVEA